MASLPGASAIFVYRDCLRCLWQATIEIVARVEVIDRARVVGGGRHEGQMLLLGARARLTAASSALQLYERWREPPLHGPSGTSWSCDGSASTRFELCKSIVIGSYEWWKLREVITRFREGRWPRATVRRERTTRTSARKIDAPGRYARISD